MVTNPAENNPGGQESPLQTPVVPVEKETYELHTRLHVETKQKLKDAAELAHKLGLIQKPDLVDLFELYITWGMLVLKKKWLDRMGYR